MVIELSSVLTRYRGFVITNIAVLSLQDDVDRACDSDQYVYPDSKFDP